MSDKAREKDNQGSTTSLSSPTSSAEAEGQILDTLLPGCLLENMPDAVIVQTVAGVIAFLCSKEAANITGQVIELA